MARRKTGGRKWSGRKRLRFTNGDRLSRFTHTEARLNRKFRREFKKVGL